DRCRAVLRRTGTGLVRRPVRGAARPAGRRRRVLDRPPRHDRLDCGDPACVETGLGAVGRAVVGKHGCCRRPGHRRCASVWRGRRPAGRRYNPPLYTIRTDMSLAFVFPGQGSQSVGMLSGLAATAPIVRSTFDEASSVLGYDLWRLCQDGPESELNATERTQPAMLAAGVA